MIALGIDVSKHNGLIDFNAVKEAGIEFVIIRAGYGKALTQIDPYLSKTIGTPKRRDLKSALIGIATLKRFRELY